MPTFFVYSPSHLKQIRWNIVQLVKFGYSREEVYFMPINELNDTIQIINQQNEEEAERQKGISKEDSAYAAPNTYSSTFGKY